MNIIEFVNTLEKDAVVESQVYEGNDTTNYQYAFGWLTGSFKSALIELELTDEQMANLDTIASRLVEKLETILM
jgi:hypothetical protein